VEELEVIGMCVFERLSTVNGGWAVQGSFLREKSGGGRETGGGYRRRRETGLLRGKEQGRAKGCLSIGTMKRGEKGRERDKEKAGNAK
jgi:hypothetical protein